MYTTYECKKLYLIKQLNGTNKYALSHCENSRRVKKDFNEEVPSFFYMLQAGNFANKIHAPPRQFKP